MVINYIGYVAQNTQICCNFNTLWRYEKSLKFKGFIGKSMIQYDTEIIGF